MRAPWNIADYSDAAFSDFILHIASLTKTTRQVYSGIVD
jgi:hypothetical protein